MTPRDRKAALMRAGWTQQKLADQLGRSQGHISQVITGKRRSRYLEQAIADLIEMPVDAVFDEPVAVPA